MTDNYSSPTDRSINAEQLEDVDVEYTGSHLAPDKCPGASPTETGYRLTWLLESVPLEQSLAAYEDVGPAIAATLANTQPDHVSLTAVEVGGNYLVCTFEFTGDIEAETTLEAFIDGVGVEE